MLSSIPMKYNNFHISLFGSKKYAQYKTETHYKTRVSIKHKTPFLSSVLPINKRYTLRAE